MRVGEYCTREVIVAEGATDAAEAARLMREHHVGDVVVVDTATGVNRPTGIVTDRDLVLEVMACGADPGSVTIDDLVTRDLFIAREEDDLMDTVDRMRTLGVRRIPVIDARGALAGILALDDVLAAVSEIMNSLTRLVSRQVGIEVRTRR